MNCKQKGTHKLEKVICNDILKTKALVFNMSYPLNCSNEILYYSEVPLVATSISLATGVSQYME